MVQNPIVSEKNKHMELDCHFIRDHYRLKAIELIQTPTGLQKGNLFTKNLNRATFESFVFEIMDRTP